jgi:hypothetical protein
MLKSWKLLIFGFGILCIVLVWFVSGKTFVSPLEPSPKLENTSARVAGATDLSAASVAQQQNTKIPLFPLPAKRPALVVELENTRNLTTFIMNAKTRPLEGGYYIAAIVALHCGQFTKFSIKEFEATEPNANIKRFGVAPIEQREAQLKKVQERCAGYLSNPENSISALYKQGTSAGDPLIKLRKELSDERMSGRKIDGTLISQVFAMNNPYAVEAAMTALQVVDEGRLLFNGAAINEDERGLVNKAMQLIPCGFGFDCGPNSIIEAEECITSGSGCGMNRFERMQSAYNTPQQWERVMYFYNEMNNAYRNGNFSIVSAKPISSGQPPK